MEVRIKKGWIQDIFWLRGFNNDICDRKNKETNNSEFLFICFGFTLLLFVFALNNWK